MKEQTLPRLSCRQSTGGRQMRRYRPMALLLLVLHLGACTKWQRVTPISPQVLIETEQPSAIRVTRADGTQVVVREPRIARDSIISAEDCKPVFTQDGRFACTIDTGRVALDEIRLLDVLRTDRPRTLLAVIVFPVVFFYGFLIAAIGLCEWADDDCGPFGG